MHACVIHAIYEIVSYWITSVCVNFKISRRYGHDKASCVKKYLGRIARRKYQIRGDDGLHVVPFAAGELKTGLGVDIKSLSTLNVVLSPV